MLSIAVTFHGQDGQRLTRYEGRLSGSAVANFRPTSIQKQKAAAELDKLGFRITSRGEMSIVVKGTKALFEKTFGCSLEHRTTSTGAAGTPSRESFFAPPSDAAWKPNEGLMTLIDDAYIQWPHIYMNQRFAAGSPQPLPPPIGYHHLRVPGDVVLTLNAARVHRQGTTGKGVRVAMIDSGFAHSHPYFVENGYNTSVVLAPGASSAELDGNGHGTGESANLLAIAPDVTFIGVKLDNETNPGSSASILEGFHEAMRHNPQVISVSLGYDLCPTDNQGRRTSNTPLSSLPNNLKALEAEIQSIVASGVVVVFSAGNGHVSFPGMMPEVISAGGVFVDSDGKMIASDYASAFDSKIYPGRHVPDFCGLVGLAANRADYIALPIPVSSEIDTGNAAHDGTRPNDGWGVFSGTSAAAPQLAGVCALLLQKNPNLKPADIKNILRRTSRDVILGGASPASNEGVGLKASAGSDGATGDGLVDAFAAWQQA